MPVLSGHARGFQGEVALIRNSTKRQEALILHAKEMFEVVET